MKYLKRYNESNRFSDRDFTNLFPVGKDWEEFTDKDHYDKIKQDFGISYDDLGYILADFVDRFDLCYRCVPKNYKDRYLIQVEFWPNVTLEKLYDDDFKFVKWLYSKMENEDSDDYMPFLDEIDDRLSDYNLTLRDLLPKDVRKSDMDFPYDFFAGGKYIQLWIGPKK